jgi:hypothetical protein
MILVTPGKLKNLSLPPDYEETDLASRNKLDQRTQQHPTTNQATLYLYGNV